MKSTAVYFLMAFLCIISKVTADITDNEYIGTFNFVSLPSTKALDVYHSSQDEGTYLILYHTTGGKSQKFSFWRTNDNYYFIQANHSGLVIEAATSEGDKLTQVHYNGGDTQQWALYAGDRDNVVFDFHSNDDSTNPKANWMLLKNKYNAYVLGVSGDSHEDETNIIQSTLRQDSYLDNYLWAIVED